MAVTERNGETLYLGTPTDLWPNALQGDAESTHAARVGLEAVASTVAHVSEFEKKMDLKRNPHLSADVFAAAMPALEKSGATVLRTLDALNNMRNVQLAAIENTLREKTPLQGPEIRNHIKTSDKPYAEAGAAIRDGDLAVAAAIFAAPARVSGLTNEEVRQLKEMAAIQFTGDTHKLLEETTWAIKRVERANEFITDYVRKKKIEWQPNAAAALKLKELMTKKENAA
mgnify:CR=1 FL=1